MYQEKSEVPPLSKEFPLFTNQETSINNPNAILRGGSNVFNQGKSQLFPLLNDSVFKEETATTTFPSPWSVNSPHSTAAISRLSSSANIKLPNTAPFTSSERQSRSENVLYHSTVRTPSRTIGPPNSLPSSGGSRSSQGSIKKRGRLETADPDIISNSDDYSRSKRIVHEGFRALRLSDQSHNYNSSSSTSLSMMDSLFETTNTGSARQHSNNSTPDSLSAASKILPQPSAPPLPSYLSSHQGVSLRKMSSVESDYSAQSEGTHSTSNLHSGLYDSDDSTVVSSSNPDPYSHHQQHQYPHKSRKRSNSSSYRHSKVPCLAKRNQGSRKSSQKTNERDEERSSSSPVDKQELERELYHILKNGKRQYMNRVDYYVDELIRKSRRKEMNEYLEQRLSNPSSSLMPTSSSASSSSYSAELMKSLNDYYVDEGFINAVIGPQPTTDHAISLIVPNPPPSSSSSRKGDNICDNINSFHPFQRRENIDGMDLDNEAEPDIAGKDDVKPIRRKGDVTHSDWEIEEIVDPAAASNNKSSDSKTELPINPDSIVNIEDLTDSNQATITDPTRQQYYQTFATFLKKRLQDFNQRGGGSGSSIRSTSGDYGHGNSSMSNTCSLGDMSDGGNDSDMACCDDWSQNLSSNNQSEDEEDVDLHSSNGGDLKNSVNGGSRKSSIGSVNSSNDGRRRDMKFIFSSSDLLSLRQQEQQKVHRQFSRSSSSPPILASLHDVTVSDAVDSRYRSDERGISNGFNDSQLMIDDTSDEGEPMHRHLENDTFPTQQNHMRFFEQSQREVRKGSEEKESSGSAGGSGPPSSSMLHRRKDLLNVYTPLFHSVSDDETEDVINVGVF